MSVQKPKFSKSDFSELDESKTQIQVCNLSPNLILLEILNVALPFTSIYLLRSKEKMEKNEITFLDSFIIIYRLFLCCFFFGSK